MKYLITIALLFGSVVPRSYAKEPPKQQMGVSIIQLIANPEKYDGKLVRVIGYLAMGERAGLYLHREDQVNALDSNAIAVIPNKEMIAHSDELSGTYVWIVGVVRTMATPGGGLATDIEDITECGVWSDPNHPITLGNKNLQRDKR